MADKFTIKGTVHDHFDNPVPRALVRATPSPAGGTDLVNDVVFANEVGYVYTDANGKFSMDLVTWDGLYYTLDITQGGSPLIDPLVFKASAKGSITDISDLPANVQIPDVVNGGFATGVTAQWVLDQIKAEQRLQLGLAAAL